MQYPFIVLIYETTTTRVLEQFLEENGYHIIIIKNISEIEILLQDNQPELILMEAFLSGVNTLELCQKIRRQSSAPIIVLGSNQDQVHNTVKYLEAGADDYVAKFASPDELLARVRALLRRSKRSDKQLEKAFRYDKLTIDFSAYLVTIDNREIPLTVLEYMILAYLANNAGLWLTTDQILAEVWGDNYLGEAHLVQVNINRIRRKLGDDARNPHYLLTRSGVGYMLKK